MKKFIIGLFAAIIFGIGYLSGFIDAQSVLRPAAKCVPQVTIHNL